MSNKESTVKYKDPTCIPPYGSSYKTSNDFRKAQLNKEMTFSYTMIIVSTILFVILGIILSYLIYYFVKRIQDYYTTKNQNETEDEKIREKAGSVIHKVNNEQNDDESYVTRENTINHAENKDDYQTFNDSIQKSIMQFKKYNQKVSKFFQDNYEKKTPDNIDERILDKQFDDW